MLQEGPTASRPTYRLIQVLRAIAALMVVAHHSTLELAQRNDLPVSNWTAGGSGVDLFFVISGFVMTLSSSPLRHAKHPARTFLARRLERVVPMYWLMTTLKVVLLLLLPAAALNGLGSLPHVIGSYLFLTTRNATGATDPILVVGWTLNFEMFFYVLFAVVLAVRAPLLRTLGPVLAILGALYFIFPLGAHTSLVRWYFNTIIWEFLFGILLALGVRHVVRIPGWCAAVLLVVGLGSLWLWGYPTFVWWRSLAWGLPACGVVAAALSLERRFGHRAPRWLLEFGDASYSIYLVHGFVLPLLGVALSRIGTHWTGVIPVSLVVMTIMSTLAGEALYRLVELPITRWFKGRRRTAVPAVG